MENSLTIALKVVEYVTSAPMFWGSMGFTVSIAMFIGAIIHDGDFTSLKKTILSMAGYLFILIQVTLTRIINDLPNVTMVSPYRMFAGITTLIFITFFWSVGLFTGVLILRFKKHKGV